MKEGLRSTQATKQHGRAADQGKTIEHLRRQSKEKHEELAAKNGSTNDS